MNITLIAAMDNSMLIGSNGTIPWIGKIPREMRHFRERTTHKVVVMGRKTFDSLGSPLKNRENVVLTTDPTWRADGVTVIHDTREVLRRATASSDEIMIIGGNAIYTAFLPHANKLDLTMVEHDFVGDTYFPTFDHDQWDRVSEDYHPVDEQNHFPIRFVTLIRK